MTTTFTIHHTFDVDADTFWRETFMNDEFNKDLYVNHLGFTMYDVVEKREEAGGVLYKKVRTAPKAEAPGPVKKLLGDSLTYVEEGRFDPATKRYEFTITPSTLADKIAIRGEFWVEPRGDAKCERFTKTDVDVRIFGVGKIVEGFVEKTTKDSYDKAAARTRAYLREKGLTK